jgi:hypothetical protein
MLRLGSPSTEAREMNLDDIFVARLKLLIVMAKAYLGNYALGDQRCRAMLENARHVEAESMALGDMLGNIPAKNASTETIDRNDLFYQRVKLLAVMVKSIAKGFPMEEHRKSALQENLDTICQTLAFNCQEAAFFSTRVA